MRGQRKRMTGKPSAGARAGVHQRKRKVQGPLIGERQWAVRKGITKTVVGHEGALEFFGLQDFGLSRRTFALEVNGSYDIGSEGLIEGPSADAFEPEQRGVRGRVSEVGGAVPGSGSEAGAFARTGAEKQSGASFAISPRSEHK